MNDLIAFINARLDDDEETARVATQGDWVWSREFVTPPGYHHRTVGPLEPGDAAHIARHDPARILAEVKAKRRIVAMHVQVQPKWCRICDVPGDYPGPAEGCTTVRLLALPYASHPDYRDEWRP